jgi:cell division protein FtsL
MKYGKRKRFRRGRLVSAIGLRWVLRPLAVTMIIAGGFSLVWIRAQVQEVRYRLVELEWELKAVQQEKRELLRQRAALSAPARIERRAKRAGFSLADRSRIFIVNTDRRTPQVRDAAWSVGGLGPGT